MQYVPSIRREEKHANRTQVVNSNQRELQNVEQTQVVNPTQEEPKNMEQTCCRTIVIYSIFLIYNI